MTTSDLLRYCVNFAMTRTRNDALEEAARVIEEAYGPMSARCIRQLKTGMPSPPEWGEDDLVLKPDDRGTPTIVSQEAAN